MVKASKDDIAVLMHEKLNCADFKNIFAPVVIKTASVDEKIENVSQAVQDFEAFEVFAKKSKDEDEEKEGKKDKDDEEDEDKKDKKKDKKKKSDDEDEDDGKDKKKKDKKEDKDDEDEKEDKKSKKSKDSKEDKKDKDDKKEDKKDSKKSKASANDKYAGAIRYIVETLTRTSDVLDNMGLEKGAMATMAALDHIIEEAAYNLVSEAGDEDDNDVRGADLLLGLEDPEARADYEDDELDDPKSSAVLEEILGKNPHLVDEIAPKLEERFSKEHEEHEGHEENEQLRDRIKARIEDMIDSSDTLPTEPDFGAPKPYIDWQERATKPHGKRHFEESLMSDDGVVEAYNALNNWIKKEAEDESDELSNETLANLFSELDKYAK
jgi:hypothetical protein